MEFLFSCISIEDVKSALSLHLTAVVTIVLIILKTDLSLWTVFNKYCMFTVTFCDQRGLKCKKLLGLS